VDAMTDLSTLIRGMKERIVIDIAPRAQEAIEILSRYVRASKDVSTGSQLRSSAGRGGGGNPLAGDSLDRAVVNFLGGIVNWRTNQLIKGDIASGVASGTKVRDEDIMSASARADKMLKLQTETAKRVKLQNAGIRQENRLAQLGSFAGGLASQLGAGLGAIPRMDERRGAAQAAQMARRFSAWLGTPGQEKKQSAVSRQSGVNKAIKKGTLDAWMAINRRNPVAEKQLTEAKKQTTILSDIAGKIAGGGNSQAAFTEVGIN